MQYETYVIIIVSLVLSAFFSGMEIAYVSANRVRLSMYKGDGSLKGRAISKLLERPDKYNMLVRTNCLFQCCWYRRLFLPQ